MQAWLWLSDLLSGTNTIDRWDSFTCHKYTPDIGLSFSQTFWEARPFGHKVDWPIATGNLIHHITEEAYRHARPTCCSCFWCCFRMRLYPVNCSRNSFECSCSLICFVTMDVVRIVAKLLAPGSKLLLLLLDVWKENHGMNPEVQCSKILVFYFQRLTSLFIRSSLSLIVHQGKHDVRRKEADVDKFGSESLKRTFNL